MPEDIQKWGVEVKSALDRINCRIYEARKLNDKAIGLTFTEPLPVYCMDKSSTNTIDNKPDE